MIASDVSFHSLYVVFTICAERGKEIWVRIHLTEIELGFAAKQYDENENGTGVYSLPAIKTQEIAFVRSFNSRIVKHHDFKSIHRIGNHPNVIRIELRTATRRRRVKEKEEAAPFDIIVKVLCQAIIGLSNSRNGFRIKN